MENLTGKIKKTGIMGGTFNPVHNAHLILAEQAYEQFGLDRIIFIPSGTPAYKNLDSVIDASHRYEMTRLAIEDNEKFDISDIDIRREGNTYTVDTLQVLKDEMPDSELYFILGGDSLFQFENWRSPEKILSMCHIIAACRDSHNAEQMQLKADELNARYGSDIKLLNTPLIDISSSALREMAAQGRSIRYYTTDKVFRYIKENKLYSR